jgi:hypothetical protein
MIVFELVQWVFRSMMYAGMVLQYRWGRRRQALQAGIGEPRDIVSQSMPEVQPRLPEAPVLPPSDKAEPAVRVVPVPDADFVGGQSITRYGEGYSVVGHFYRRQSRVRRVIWLDYKALQRKHGAFVVRRLRIRAGGSDTRARVGKGGKSARLPAWGRIGLPDEYLEFESLQDLRVIRLMEKSVDEAAALIEEEIPDNLLNKRPWRLLPPCAAPDPEPTDLQKRTRTIERTMEELRLEDAGRKVPLATQDKEYPTMVKPPVSSSHAGVLRNTGYVERTDPSGRKYRTFFADVEDEVRTLRHIGVDLQRALLREQVNIGDRVEVFNIGLVPVGSGKYKKKIWGARKLPS